VASYEVRLKRSARKELGLVDSRENRARLVAAMERLASNPRPVGSVKLATSDSSYLAAPLDLQRAAELEMANACERVARADGRRRIVECINSGRGGPGAR
jgi:hypothetical protein